MIELPTEEQKRRQRKLHGGSSCPPRAAHQMKRGEKHRAVWCEQRKAVHTGEERQRKEQQHSHDGGGYNLPRGGRQQRTLPFDKIGSCVVSSEPVVSGVASGKPGELYRGRRGIARIFRV